MEAAWGHPWGLFLAERYTGRTCMNLPPAAPVFNICMGPHADSQTPRTSSERCVSLQQGDDREAGREVGRQAFDCVRSHHHHSIEKFDFTHRFRQINSATHGRLASVPT
jgi:hypothetical protein